MRDLGLGPGLEFEKSGTRDWDRDASKNQGPEPGLTIFSGTSIISNQKIREPGPGLGLKIEKSGIGDWDRDSDLRDEGFRASTLKDRFAGTKKFRDSVPGTENFPRHGPGPVPTPAGQLRNKTVRDYF